MHAELLPVLLVAETVRDPAAHDALIGVLVTGTLGLIGSMFAAIMAYKARDHARSAETLGRQTYDTVNSVETEVDHHNPGELTLGQTVKKMHKEMNEGFSNAALHRASLQQTVGAQGQVILGMKEDLVEVKRRADENHHNLVKIITLTELATTLEAHIPETIEKFREEK